MSNIQNQLDEINAKLTRWRERRDKDHEYWENLKTKM